MPTVVCRACGNIRQVNSFDLYVPIHILPGIYYIRCPQCNKFRLHRNAKPWEMTSAQVRAQSNTGADEPDPVGASLERATQDSLSTKS